MNVKGCLSNSTAFVSCQALPGVECAGDRDFLLLVPCRYTKGYKYTTALALSIFFGNIGLDRFYLGYTTIGILKLCTFGFFVIGNIVDIVLIATQALGPSDGSAYELDHVPPVSTVPIAGNLKALLVGGEQEM
eukprot:CAMPEP_0184316874 /NCGR_PEP_ID=MMETSP1049-20130417/93009_1 /TAXON_ID=77928 /ORGANISM="Proteomonas sulcata, Strain CCMP704" /LENGTH=132 /DNA_ID=CAMNT_0026636027 /DNA_START=49 /DNA_END=447 /DNA_ORIENTATION=-